jgi:hypothetical protein
LRRGQSVLDRVAADEHCRTNTIRVKRRRNTCGAPTSVVSGNGEALQAQGIRKINEILADR